MLGILVVLAGLAATTPPQPMVPMADHGRPPIVQQTAETGHSSDAAANHTEAMAGAGPSQPIYVQAACEHGCGYSEDNKSWWRKLWTDPVATFTAALALLTLGLIVAGAVQGWLIYQQIRLGREEFIATHRPRLRIRRTDNLVTHPGKVPMATVWAANTGDTDAHVFEIGVDVFPRNPHNRLGAGFNATNKPHVMQPIAGGKEARIDVLGSQPLAVEQIKKIEAGELEVCILGIFNYKDQNGVARSTSFFQIWRPELDRFVKAPEDDPHGDRNFED